MERWPLEASSPRKCGVFEKDCEINDWTFADAQSRGMKIWIEMSLRYLFLVRSHSRRRFTCGEKCCLAKSEFSLQASHSLHLVSYHEDIFYV